MKILLVASTAFEIGPTLEFLEKNAEKKSFFEFEFNGHIIYPLVTGVGSVMMSFNLARFNNIHDMDLVVNMGVAGVFDQKLELGDVIEVEKDRFADLGVEELDGSFTDIHELELLPADQFPFEKGWLIPKTTDFFNISKNTAITVNKVQGNELSIKRISNKYRADIESMEGAAFHYACKMMDLKHVQIRAISNFIEPRDKNRWKLDLAINNLNSVIVKNLGKSR